VRLLNLDQTTLMEVNSLQRDANQLVIKGTLLGSMPVTCVLTPSEARALFKLLNPKTFFFLLTFLFRR
jgi:hypothetical protein